MKNKKVRQLILWLSLATLSPRPSPAVDIVLDLTNLIQNTVSAIEDVEQTLQLVQQYATQLQQYQTQIQQYQNMLQNTLQPTINIWQRANQTINGVLQTIDTLSRIENQFGGLGNYLKTFSTLSGYKTNPCLLPSGCSQGQWDELLATRSIISDSEKAALDASILGLQQQQGELQKDSQVLVDLQSAAQSAEGHLQAIGYANQLASAEANQLLQIRALLIAQQNALTTRMQAEVDKEAQEQAAGQLIRVGDPAASALRSW